MIPLDFDQFHGARRNDGTIIGFDYASQKWVDTALGAKRNAAFPVGSANNPFAHLRDLPPSRKTARAGGSRQTE